MEPIDLTTPLSVTLEAQQWNAVIDILYDGRCRVAMPLIQRITEQLQTGAGQLVPARSNGETVHAPH